MTLARLSGTIGPLTGSAATARWKGPGDRAVRLVGGDEDLVDVLQSEGFQVDQDAMLVGHDQGDPLDLRTRVEHGLAHCVERLLH